MRLRRMTMLVLLCAAAASLGCAPRPTSSAPAPGARTITSAEQSSPRRVIFTSQQPKMEAIRSVHPALSYGDSDGDIADTHEADPAIRANRMIRSPVSNNERPTTPGEYGEEILANSAD